MVFFEILIISYIGIFIFYLYGNLICNSIETEENFINYSLISIYGFINISLIALALNFFLPINNLICDLIFLFGLILSIYLFFKKKKKINIFIYFFLISVITLLMLSYSNINRPDAGLYHIPYVQILHENKILVGLSNLHFRFGHISILQYSASIFNNSIFPLEALNVPLAIIVSIFFIYFFSYFMCIKKNKELKIFLFLITIYSFYAFNQYSDFGNDTTAHLFFFLFIIKVLEIDFKKIDPDQFGSLILISTFAYLQKPFMIFLFLIISIIFLIFIKKNIYNLITNKKISLSLFLIFFWTTKNLLVSGCAIYPLAFTCFKQLSYVDENKIKEISIQSEAWAKDWPNFKNNDISQKKYIIDFKWFKTWKKNHFKKVLEKLGPFVIFISLLIIILLFYNQNKIDTKYHKFIKIKIIFIISILLSFFWFIKFPLYRYGQSFLVVYFVSIFTYFFVKYIDLKKSNKLLVSVLIVSMSLIVIKNSSRIYKKKDIRNVYPNIYTLSEFKGDNLSKQVNPIIINDKFRYFFNQNECMYSKSPCTNFTVEILIKEIFGYTIIMPKNNNTI